MSQTEETQLNFPRSHLVRGLPSSLAALECRRGRTPPRPATGSLTVFHFPLPSMEMKFIITRKCTDSLRLLGSSFM